MKPVPGQKLQQADRLAVPGKPFIALPAQEHINQHGINGDQNALVTQCSMLKHPGPVQSALEAFEKYFNAPPESIKPADLLYIIGTR